MKVAYGNDLMNKTKNLEIVSVLGQHDAGRRALAEHIGRKNQIAERVASLSCFQQVTVPIELATAAHTITFNTGIWTGAIDPSTGQAQGQYAEGEPNTLLAAWTAGRQEAAVLRVVPPFVHSVSRSWL